MPPHDLSLEEDEYRLILVRSGSRAIWTDCDANGPHLPRVMVLKWRRPAEQLQEAIEAARNIRVVVLDIPPVKHGSVPCAIAEIVSSDSHLCLTATSIDEIPTEEINLEEREVLQAILDEDACVRGPFSRVGWIKEAIEWLRTEAGHEVALIEGIRQYDASGRFALVRFRIQAGSVSWLKATGEPNVHEFHVTRKLATLCPESVPAQIVAREDWNAWLMADAGQPLDSSELPLLEVAILSMAGLQKKTIGQSTELLAAGAFNHRIPTLRANLAQVLEFLDEAMSKQTSAKVPRICQERLRHIEGILHDTWPRPPSNIPAMRIMNHISCLF